MKRQIRVLGIDDGPFDKFDKKQKHALVVGSFYRGGDFLDGILSTKVKIDETDSTKKIAEMINRCKWKSLIQAVLLDGLAVAGFNLVDISLLKKKIDIPVIVVMRQQPDITSMKNALKKIGMEKKISLLDKAGSITKIDSGIHFQHAGCTKEFARDIIKLTTRNAEIPEPLRISHIIATGIVKGESKGRS